MKEATSGVHFIFFLQEFRKPIVTRYIKVHLKARPSNCQAQKTVKNCYLPEVQALPLLM